MHDWHANSISDLLYCLSKHINVHIPASVNDSQVKHRFKSTDVLISCPRETKRGRGEGVKEKERDREREREREEGEIIFAPVQGACPLEMAIYIYI